MIATYASKIVLWSRDIASLRNTLPYPKIPAVLPFSKGDYGPKPGWIFTVRCDRDVMVVYRSKEYGFFGAAGLGELPLTSFHLAAVNAMDEAPPCASGILPRSLLESTGDTKALP